MMTSSYFYKENSLCARKADGTAVELHSLTEGRDHGFYIYSLDSIQNKINALKSSLGPLKNKIHYALKANSHPKILDLFKKNGIGADVVSGGEMNWALKHGFAPSDIIFSGVGKSKTEIRQAIEQDIYQINVESLSEVSRIGEIATELQKKVRLGIRLNPNIKVDTHPYITTGFRENKFGIPEEQIKKALQIIKKNQPWLELQGISAHIGSQIREISPMMDSAKSLLTTYESLVRQGVPLKNLDIGGGVGINYLSEDESDELAFLKTYGEGLQSLLSQFPGQLLTEPGRILVGRSGILCTRVEYIKDNGFKNFIVVNSGMNHIMRPSLYKAHHRILPLKPQLKGAMKNFDVVGPICESSDVLGADRAMATPKEGDWLALMDAGAYGMSMASTYNHHALPEEVII
ncbi:MAG: diaminopimelate decarboxylase [Bdellovibrionales bacterium]|nr:diaminopimelate decarboxylase [Bdellovibrionales bacterium]